MANLAENKKCFNRVVPSGQDFDQDYSGIFRFRFWRFGEWVEIVIDDRLPTRRGQLIYLRSIEKHEFWGALLGMISNEMSITTNFVHKHFKNKFYHKFAWKLFQLSSILVNAVVSSVFFNPDELLINL